MNDRRVLHYVKVISGNRITLPEDVRKDLGCVEGSNLALTKTKFGWEILPAQFVVVRARRPR